MYTVEGGWNQTPRIRDSRLKSRPPDALRDPSPQTEGPRVRGNGGYFLRRHCQCAVGFFRPCLSLQLYTSTAQLSTRYRKACDAGSIGRQSASSICADDQFPCLGCTCLVREVFHPISKARNAAYLIRSCHIGSDPTAVGCWEEAVSGGAEPLFTGERIDICVSIRSRGSNEGVGRDLNLTHRHHERSPAVRGFGPPCDHP
jgi:hypothetical protein